MELAELAVEEKHILGVIRQYQVFCHTLEPFFAHSVDQPERTELCGFESELLIRAEDERPNGMLIPSMMGADVAGLRRASLHEVFTHI